MAMSPQTAYQFVSNAVTQTIIGTDLPGIEPNAIKVLADLEGSYQKRPSEGTLGALGKGFKKGFTGSQSIAKGFGLLGHHKGVGGDK